MFKSKHFSSIKRVILPLFCMWMLILSGCSNPSPVMESEPPAPNNDGVVAVDAADTADVSIQIADNDTIGMSFDEAIEIIIANRLEALEAKDYDAYMHDITRTNQFYFNEQERWFMEMIDDTIRNIQLEVLEIELIDDTTAVATIHQTHQTYEMFDFDYPLLFKYENDGWKDYGYDFEVKTTERFLVKYMPGERKVDTFTDMLNDAFDHLAEIYTLRPLDDYEMKLFQNQELLRQRTVPSNPWLFTGWSEPDESLKIYTGYDLAYEQYAGVIQHELVHHISIRMCNNNLPLWLLEGIAMYDGSAYYGLENSSLLSSITEIGVRQTIHDLETNDLNQNLTSEEIYDFYRTSYMYVKFIHDTYGREALTAIFETAGEKPFHDSTLNDSFEANNQATADDVLLEVLGMTKEALSDAYLEWLRGEF